MNNGYYIGVITNSEYGIHDELNLEIELRYGEYYTGFVQVYGEKEIYDLLISAKVQNISELKGKPVRVRMIGDKLSFTILKEAIL